MPARTSTLPTVNERIVLQSLLSGEWKSAVALQVKNPKALAGIVAKDWIEQQGGGSIKAEFRITEVGRAVFRARMP